MSFILEQVRNVLVQKLGGINPELLDNSHLHRGHDGVKGKDYEVSHLKITISSGDVPGRTILEKHRYLNGILKDYFKKIHSIEIILV